MEEGPNIPPQTLRRLIMSKLKFNSYYRIVHADEIVVSKKYIIASINNILIFITLSNC